SDLRGIIQNNNLRLGLGDSKDDGIRTAEQVGNFMATFFMILGLFSIGAGVLLIIMIFVMLAAERKSEMGMARAVGMKRGHVVQTVVTVTFASCRISNVNIVAAIRGTAEDKRPEHRRRIRWWWVVIAIPAMIFPPLGLWFLLRNGLGLPSAWILSGFGLLFGTLFVLLGLSSDKAFTFALGFSLIAAGLARLLTLLKFADRPACTAVG